MHAMSVSWFFAGLLAIAAPAHAWAADPVEDLLLGHSSPATSDDSAVPLIEPETAMRSATIPAVAPQDDATDWVVAPDQGLKLATDDTGDHKSGAASRVNAVPEPAARLLALAALVYFMLFGRRRRMA
jgi:hypothetical protein